jgi:hypothetical protein
MQISETLSQDLHKQFTVTVLASELDSRVNARLEEMKPRVNLKGFRPGKAPVSFLKKQFGKSIMGEVVEAAVNEGSQKAIADNKLKPALQPRVEPVGSVEEVVDGKADLTFKVIVDLMPDFETTDVSKLTVERLTADIGDADVDEALDRLAKNVRNYAAKDGAAEKDDVVVIDYVGSIDGVPFEGGKGSDFSLTLGSGTSFPASRTADRRQGGRKPRREGDLPGRISRPGNGRQGRGVRRHGEGSEGPGRDQDRRRAGQEAGPGRSCHPQGSRARAAGQRLQGRQPPAPEAPRAGCAGRRP